MLNLACALHTEHPVCSSAWNLQRHKSLFDTDIDSHERAVGTEAVDWVQEVIEIVSLEPSIVRTTHRSSQDLWGYHCPWKQH